jgi:hypothetical protein
MLKILTSKWQKWYLPRQFLKLKKLKNKRQRQNQPPKNSQQLKKKALRVVLYSVD